ncbi:unnamed protein product [Moneuplotes crassus]|uniref:Uncharacterized protein n=1 Tax=Euplotes crassus TaxID=5936 RepID=A0AAD2D131_EUPCR|nr:unnamed protein product [Moneuplotes crassus]
MAMKIIKKSQSKAFLKDRARGVKKLKRKLFWTDCRKRNTGGMFCERCGKPCY